MGVLYEQVGTALILSARCVRYLTHCGAHVLRAVLASILQTILEDRCSSFYFIGREPEAQSHNK